MNIEEHPFPIVCKNTHFQYNLGTFNIHPRVVIFPSVLIEIFPLPPGDIKIQILHHKSMLKNLTPAVLN
jgi:hypothetical protein